MTGAGGSARAGSQPGPRAVPPPASPGAIPDTMRAARLYAWDDVRVEHVPVPRPGPGEALVRVEACGVCGSDALTWYVERKAPVVLGHEPAGIVVEVGEGVARPALGERVFIHHHAPCMACEECRRGLWSSCATWRASRLDPGGFAEYVRVPAVNLERDTLPLPEAMSFETATFIEPLACCIRAVRRQGAVAEGDVALIVGLGAMGQLMLQLARAYGARLVAASDFLPDRRALALELGADHAFDPAADDPAAALRALTCGRGADAVVVCPGDLRAIDAGVAAAAPGGRVVCFTPLPPDRPIHLDPAVYFHEVTLLQSYSCGPDETRDALRLLHEGRIRVDPLVTHRTGLDGVGEALLRAAGKGAGLKTIVFPGR